MSTHLLSDSYRSFVSAIAAMLLIAISGTLSVAATIPFVEDFSGTAPDFSISSSNVGVTGTVGSGVLTVDSLVNTGGQALNAVVNITDAGAREIVMETDFTPTAFTPTGGSTAGFLAFSTNPTAGALPGGVNSGYLADIFFPTSTLPGTIRLLDLASGAAVIAQSAAFPAGALAINETYHLAFTATPRLDGLLDLSFTITDTAGTLVDGVGGDGILTIVGTTPAAASTGTSFGYRHRVGNNAANRTFDAVYDNFSVVPEPSVYLLGGIGLIGLAFIRKRQAK